jgi:catechol 2,3-dioxygenase-like lactoylglutathione lyase family enzyme
MAYHHLALFAKDMAAIHAFYEGVMGFELVKVEIGPSPAGGWAKHFFYRMENDSSFIAFWEMHDAPGMMEFKTNISTAAGLPEGINHISFNVTSREALDARKQAWVSAGLDVLEIDHNWCHSIYTRDPNGNMVEFCLTTGSFTATDREVAIAALTAQEPLFSPPPASIKVHNAVKAGV